MACYSFSIQSSFYSEGPANRSTFLGFAVTFYTELGDLPEMVKDVFKDGMRIIFLKNVALQ
jgi:hypothetical protein